MIIEELKKFLRATILMSTDLGKKELCLELLEKIIAMEQKLQASKDIYIEPPEPDLPKGWINPLTGQIIPEPPKMMTATDFLIREKNLFPGATIDPPVTDLPPGKLNISALSDDLIHNLTVFGSSTVNIDEHGNVSAGR